MTGHLATVMRHNASAYVSLAATVERARGADAARLPTPPGSTPPTDLHRLDLLAASADAAARTASTIATILEPSDSEQAESLRRHVAALPPAGAWDWSAERADAPPEPVADQLLAEALDTLAPIVRYLGGHPAVPALLACPHCRCLTVAPRPRRPDILTCTNPHCAPAPRTWSLRDGEWSNFPELS
jgi:hypothetical protein